MPLTGNDATGLHNTSLSNRGNGENTVTVADVACDIESESTTEIVCVTNERSSSAKTHVVVEVSDNGNSLQVMTGVHYSLQGFSFLC